MYWKLLVPATQIRAEEIAQFFEDTALASAWYETDHNKQQWCAEILFSEKPEENWIKSGLVDEHYTLDFLAERDWVRENQAAFPPIDVGSFYIYGSHIRTLPPSDKIALHIDAATAFGTGEHETTQGCLMLLDQLKAENYHFQNILDLGCGTGVLGMAAALLFNQQSVTLSDNDPEATEMATLNIQQNKLSHRIKVITSEGFEQSELCNRAPFDLIIANILAAPLIALSPDMNKHSSEHSFIILSGLLETQAADIIDSYKQAGFSLVYKKILGEWCALLLKKA